MRRTDTEIKAPKLWPPDAKRQLVRKDPDARKVWRQEEKGTTEDEMVGWHHRLDGHEFEQAPGVGDGQGSLASCGPWGRKESDMTKWMKNKNLSIFSPLIVCMCLLSLSDRMQPDWFIVDSSKALIAMPHTKQTLHKCLQDGCTKRELWLQCIRCTAERKEKQAQRGGARPGQQLRWEIIKTRAAHGNIY